MNSHSSRSQLRMPGEFPKLERYIRQSRATQKKLLRTSHLCRKALLIAFDFATGLSRTLYTSPKCVPEKPPSFGINTSVNGSLFKEHILGSEEVSLGSSLFPCPQATNIAKPELATRKQISLSTISPVNQRLLVIAACRCASIAFSRSCILE